MKSSQFSRNFLIIALNNLINQPQWENLFISSASRCLSFSRCWLQLARTKVKSLSLNCVHGSVLVIRAVYQLRLNLIKNKRYLVGGLSLAAGVTALFAGGLFFDPLLYNHAPCELFGLTNQCFSFETQKGWCFMSWYVYFENIGIWIAIVFWSITGFLWVPKKFSGRSAILFSFCGALAWVKLLHVNFFARSTETYRVFDWQIEWPLLLAAFVLGIFGVVMSKEASDYWENHKKRGNWQRWPAVHKANIDQQSKNKLFDELTEEYYKVNRMI